MRTKGMNNGTMSEASFSATLAVDLGTRPDNVREAGSCLRQ